MVHLPPPVNGVSLISEQVVNSRRLHEQFNLQVLPLRSSSSISDIGKLRPAKFLRIFTQVWELCRCCWIHRPVVVYFTLTPNGAAFYRDLLYVAIMKLFRVRRLYHLHGKGILRALTGTVAKVSYAWAFNGAEVILLSPALLVDAAQVLQHSSYHFLANGITDPWRDGHNPKIKQGGPPRILFFSNLVVNKGIFVLLDALAMLVERGIPFQAAFAGVWESPAVEAEFACIVQEKGLKAVVELCGPKYGEQKRHTFAEADIMAFPTYNDAYPLVVLEAMSHGLPVVSTYEGAIPDMVRDGENGFLVPVKDPAAVADCLLKLIVDPGLRTKMGQAGRNRYEQEFTQSVFEQGLLEILSKCVAQKW